MSGTKSALVADFLIGMSKGEPIVIVPRCARAGCIGCNGYAVIVPMSRRVSEAAPIPRFAGD